MLPLILGGIAVVATSCAIKEYYEEEEKKLNKHIPTHEKPKSIVDTYLEERVYLSDVAIPRLLVLLRAVNESYTLKRAKPLAYSELPMKMLSTDVKNYMYTYNYSLQEAESIWSQYMVGLEVLLNKNVSYDKYDEEEQFFIKKAQIFIKKLDKYLNIPLYDDMGELPIKSRISMIKGLRMIQRHHGYTKIIDKITPDLDWSPETGFKCGKKK